MSDYTPTTEQVFEVALLGAMDAVASVRDSLDIEEFRGMWDRWLAAHDAEVSGKALRDAAAEVTQAMPDAKSPAQRNRMKYAVGFLTASADTIELEAEVGR